MTLLLMATALTNIGCDSVESRIKENQAMFNTWPPEVQNDVRAGVVKLGHDKSMVQVALGKPQRVESSTTTAGVSESWFYTASYFTSERYYVDPHNTRGPRSTSGVFTHEYVDVEHPYDKLKIEFEAGKVKAIHRVNR